MMYAEKTGLLVLVLGALCVALVAGCGGDDDDDDDNDTDDDDAGDDDDTGDDDDAGDDDNDDDDCGSPDLLPGTWESSDITMEIAEDLSFHSVGINDVGYDVTGTISVDGCTMSFVDETGDQACPSDQIGEYDYVVTETTLTTTLVSDPCAGRVMGLDGTEFSRVE